MLTVKVQLNGGSMPQVITADFQNELSVHWVKGFVQWYSEKGRVRVPMGKVMEVIDDGVDGPGEQYL